MKSKFVLQNGFETLDFWEMSIFFWFAEFRELRIWRVFHCTLCNSIYVEYHFFSFHSNIRFWTNIYYMFVHFDSKKCSHPPQFDELRTEWSKKNVLRIKSNLMVASVPKLIAWTDRVRIEEETRKMPYF